MKQVVAEQEELKEEKHIHSSPVIVKDPKPKSIAHQTRTHYRRRWENGRTAIHMTR